MDTWSRGIEFLICSLVLLTVSVGDAVAQPLGIDGVDSLPKEFADPAFDRYANMFLVYRAWHERDPMMLTDAAMQFVEGERILLRPRKGLSADDLFKLAIEAAQAEGDEATLRRLEKAIANRDPALKQQLALARQLGGKSRVWKSELQVSVQDTSPIEFALFKEYLGRIDDAKERRDRRRLKGVQAQLVTERGLSEKLLRTLTKQAADALENLPATDKLAADKQRLLELLGRRSRGEESEERWTLEEFDALSSMPDESDRAFQLDEATQRFVREKYHEEVGRGLDALDVKDVDIHSPTTIYNLTRHSLAIALATEKYGLSLSARSHGWQVLRPGESIDTLADYALVLAINNGRTTLVPIEDKDGRQIDETKLFAINEQSFAIKFDATPASYETEEEWVSKVREKGYTPAPFTAVQGYTLFTPETKSRPLYIGKSARSRDNLETFFAPQ